MRQNFAQRGIAHIFLIILLVGGIILGVYLTGQTQIFRPKAQEVSPVEIYTTATGTERVTEQTPPRPAGPVYLEIKEIRW